MNLITIKDASDKSGISARTLYDKIERNLLKTYINGKKTLVDYTEVLKFRKIVILLYNMKGGVGKTTVGSLLSFYFADKGYKTLGLDLDPQENFTSTFGNIDKSKPTLYNFLDKYQAVENKKILLETTIQNVYPNLDIIPSHINLADYNELQIEKIEAIKETFYSVFDRYNIVVIDCPPTFSGFTKLGIMLSNYIFVPLFPDTFSYDGIKYTLTKMDMILKFNKDFIDFRAFMNKIKPRENSTKQYYTEAMKTSLRDKIFNNQIPDFSYIDEVHATKENLFQTYKKHKHTISILDAFIEMENYIYEVK